ncbi:head maturation protease, ClpP-related [Pelosinus sp. IPA-1]|uniref:head maturation protease, ClpP-related n=1 Tax=Pelosinus sp. IPA-1 TaxID=3029569 RepID=UPI00243623D8|nr:head maturation protease, ClpP-related [Pelosinus sp. IPA-1]GMB00428.1 hypothetical protein PIPA1_32270 [Pelosinus sp. IPA-1]
MKFWSFKNSLANVGEVELILYGDISKTSWWGDEVTPEQFAKDLAACTGKDVRVRIDSDGGDVFAAHNICNQLKNYAGNVTICVDGIAASAATIIMTAGKVIMPVGSMIMIHNPTLQTGWGASFDATELANMSQALETIKQNIIDVYMQKCNLTQKQLSSMMDAETWMTASMALQYGFADEIENSTGSGELLDQETDDGREGLMESLLPTMVDGNYLVVNNASRHDVRRLSNVAGLRNAIAQARLPKVQNNMRQQREETTVIIKNCADLRKAYPDLCAELAADAVGQESARIAALDALDNVQNAAIHAIVCDAKKTGKSAENVKTFVEIINKMTPAAPSDQQAPAPGAHPFAKVIEDSAQSGVNGVGSGGQIENKDKKEVNAAADYMAEVMNRKNGVAK